MRLRYLTSVIGPLALGFSVAFAPAPSTTKLWMRVEIR